MGGLCRAVYLCVCVWLCDVLSCTNQLQSSPTSPGFHKQRMFVTFAFMCVRLITCLCCIYVLAHLFIYRVQLSPLCVCVLRQQALLSCDHHRQRKENKEQQSVSLPRYF